MLTLTSKVRKGGQSRLRKSTLQVTCVPRSRRSPQLPLFPFSTLINFLSLSNVGLYPQFPQVLPFCAQLADSTLGGQFNALMCDRRPYKGSGHQQEAKKNSVVRLFWLLLTWLTRRKEDKGRVLKEDKGIFKEYIFFIRCLRGTTR